MKGKKITALLLGTCMMATVLAGCGGKAGNTDGNATTGTSTTGNGETKEAEAGVGALRDKEYADDEIITFTMFTAMPDAEINDGNDVQEIIAKKTGVECVKLFL